MADLRASVREHEALRSRLRLRYDIRHVEAAIARLAAGPKNYQQGLVFSVDNYRFCRSYIEDVLIPSESGRGQVSQFQQPSFSYNEQIRLPALTMHQELKEMGFSDTEVASAISKGHADIQACVDFLLSPANASPLPAKASPGPTISPALAASAICIAPNGKMLVSVPPPPPSPLKTTPHPQSPLPPSFPLPPFFATKEYNGWLYRTAHDRPIGSNEFCEDGRDPVAVSPGWDFCFSDKDVIHLAKTFPWGSRGLVVLDNGSMCLTAACLSGKPGENLLRSDVFGNLNHCDMHHARRNNWQALQGVWKSWNTDDCVD